METQQNKNQKEEKDFTEIMAIAGKIADHTNQFEAKMNEKIISLEKEVDELKGRS